MDIVERLYSNTDFSTGMNLAQEAADEIERLRNLLQNGSPVVEGTIQHMAMEIAALKKDAERYLWLRTMLKPRYTGRYVLRRVLPRSNYLIGKPENHSTLEVVPLRYKEVELYGIAYIGELKDWDCDAAIDAAMEEKK